MTLGFYLIVITVRLWGELFANHSILFLTDNEALVTVINRQTSKDYIVVQMVRYLVLQCLQNSNVFRAKNSPGKYNNLADSLSRLQVQEFQKMAPHAQQDPTMIPVDLMPQHFWITSKNL